MLLIALINMDNWKNIIKIPAAAFIGKEPDKIADEDIKLGEANFIQIFKTTLKKAIYGNKRFSKENEIASTIYNLLVRNYAVLLSDKKESLKDFKFINISNARYCLAIDLSMIKNISNYKYYYNELLFPNNKVKVGEEKFIDDKIIGYCTTTFMLYSYEEKILNRNSDEVILSNFAKALLKSYPCYNVAFIDNSIDTNTDISIEDRINNDNKLIRDYNNKHRYIYNSAHILHDTIVRYYSDITKNYYYVVQRYPFLVMLFDDNRIPNISLVLPASFKIHDLTALKITNIIDEHNQKEKTWLKDFEVNEDFQNIINKINNLDEIENEASGITATIFELDGFKETNTEVTVPYFISEMGTSTLAIRYDNINFNDFYALESSLDFYEVFEGIKLLEKEKFDEKYINEVEYDEKIDKNGQIERNYEPIYAEEIDDENAQNTCKQAVFFYSFLKPSIVNVKNPDGSINSKYDQAYYNENYNTFNFALGDIKSSLSNYKDYSFEYNDKTILVKYDDEKELVLLESYDSLDDIKDQTPTEENLEPKNKYQREEYIDRNKKETVTEDNIISDVYATYPIQYVDLDYIKNTINSKKEKYKNMYFIKKNAIENNYLINNLLTGLHFQEVFELGGADQNNFIEGRIERLDLGSIDVLMTEEIHYNYYKKVGVTPLDERPISLRLMLSVDTETQAGVLHVLNLNSKGTGSKFLDMVSRSNIFISTDDPLKYGNDIVRIKTGNGRKTHQCIELFKYLEFNYKITKVGQPRTLVLSPYIPTNPDERTKYLDLISSILYSKTLYNPEDELGNLVDKKIRRKASLSTYGDAVFDYSPIFISKTCMVQFGDTYKDYLIERMDFAVVNLFYLELIQFELAALGIATSSSAQFIDDYKLHPTLKERFISAFIKPATEIIKKIDIIKADYAKTLPFWDVELNYHSSKVLFERIRQSFEVQGEIEKLERVSNEILSVYESKKNAIERRNSLLMGAFGLVLTITSIVDIFAFGDTINFTWNNIKLVLFGIGLICILFYIFNKFAISKKFKNSLTTKNK